MTIRTPAVPALLAMCCALEAVAGGVLDSFPLSFETSQQWKLPNRLNEISGLALADDGRLFGVDDESAIVYELDYTRGRIVKAFALGNPAVRGDFEGIAWLDGKVYLTTSNGVIYVAPEGNDGQRVPFERYKTGLGDECEIEGLGQDRAEGTLLLVCKALRKKASIRRLAVFTWSVAERAPDVDATILLPETQILGRLKRNRLRPSGITVDPHSGNLLIVAARQYALIEVTRDGVLVSAKSLELVNRHRQSEGIELTVNGKLLIADEGGGHRARLAVYRQQQPAGDTNNNRDGHVEQ